MKNSIFTLFLFGLMMSISSMMNAEIINGNGSLNSMNYEIASYKQLRVDGNFDVYLSYGTQPSVTVMTDENLQDAVLIDNDGTTLYIRTKENIGSSSKMALYITVNSLEHMGFKDVLSINSTEALWFHTLKLTLNTFGTTKLQLACKTLDATIEGAGDLHLSGTIEDLRINNSGMGALITNDLQTEKVTINQTGTRSIEMKMTKERSTEMKMIPFGPSNYPKA